MLRYLRYAAFINMTDQNKNLAEKIIATMKSVDSNIIAETAVNHMVHDSNTRNSIMESLINDYNLVQKCGKFDFRLNSNGIEFKSFADLDNKKRDLKNRDDIELKLAISNIHANELNEQVAERNKYSTWINIFIGTINIGLLIWQIILAVQSSK